MRFFDEHGVDDFDQSVFLLLVELVDYGTQLIFWMSMTLVSSSMSS